MRFLPFRTGLAAVAACLALGGLLFLSGCQDAEKVSSEKPEAAAPPGPSAPETSPTPVGGKTGGDAWTPPTPGSGQTVGGNPVEIPQAPSETNPPPTPRIFFYNPDATAQPQPPAFPWPPPHASAQEVIPEEFLGVPGASPTLGDVDRRLRKALDASGYFETSYFSAPGGFALVTRLERINPDGTPKEGTDRWAPEVGPMKSFSFDQYLQALFTSNPGLFRIIVFIATDWPFRQSEQKVERPEAMAWFEEGLNRLPEDMAGQSYTSSHYCTALIYEFEKAKGSKEGQVKVPGRLPGRVHLQKAALWEGLAQ